jgi:hypothetical protein
MTVQHQPRPVRQRRRAILYYIVVDEEPSPDLLLQNYIWCLKEREMAAGDGAGHARHYSHDRSQGFNNGPV